MGYLRQPGSPCQPLYSQIGVSIQSFLPTSLRTTTDSYQPVLTPCPSVRRKANPPVPIYLLCLTELRRLQASGGGGIPQTSLLSFGVSFGPLLQEHRLSLEVHFPLTEESNTGDHLNTTRPLILFAAQWSVSPIAQASPRAIILHSVVQRTRPRAGLGTRRVGSVRVAPLHTITPTADHMNTRAQVNRLHPFETHS